MFSPLIAHEITRSVRISLQELLEGRYENSFSKYLSLSVKYLDRDIHIFLTTTSSEPITYLTRIPGNSSIDLATLIFEIQPKISRI
jgi:hypothetical protein